MAQDSARPSAGHSAELSRSQLGSKPLAGRRIVITRARSQAGSFARAIQDLGGEVIEFPTIEIVPPKSYEAVDRAIARIDAYGWVIFTSVNGVSHFFERFGELNGDRRSLDSVKLVAIGPQTARALQGLGLRVDVVPQEYRAEAILDALKPEEMEGSRILLPRAAEARDILPAVLRGWGAEVDVVEAYETVAAKSDPARLSGLLEKKMVDVITFTSSSTVSHFAALFPGADMAKLLGGTAVACIGPVTGKTAKDRGIRVDVVSDEYTIEGLTAAIVDYFNRRNARGGRQ